MLQPLPPGSALVEVAPRRRLRGGGPSAARSSSGSITVTTGSPSSPGPHSALRRQRRRALAVVVADVDAEAHFRPAAAAERGLASGSPLRRRCRRGTRAAYSLGIEGVPGSQV